MGLRDLGGNMLSKLKRSWPLEDEESRKKKNRVSSFFYASIRAWQVEHICIHIQNVYRHL